MLSWPTTLPISQFFLVRRLAAQVKWHCGWSTVIKHSGTGRCRKFLRDIRQRTAHAAGPRGLPPNAAISHDVDDCDDSNNQTFGNCRIPGRNSSYRPSVSPFWYAVFIEEGAFFFLVAAAGGIMHRFRKGRMFPSFFFFVFRSRSHVDAHATMTTCAALP